ncbi:allophanate hydrolase subunit 1 [Nocardioides sp. KR10-350]|uniref:5-oxoprolinase subunit B family protein n=1 Tax=Nocardioides cheoyonin TaxID=3156615 RepID=UPI0032B378D4
MRAREFGPRALLVEVGSAVEAAELAGWARAVPVAAGEIVPAAATVLFDDVASPDALRAALADWTPSGAVPAGPLVELPTAYDGPDLAFVARHWGVGDAEVVERHTTLEFTSAFCGFAPGFAYLTGLPEEWVVPRLESPRPRVPAGSVGLAGPYCGVYPSASPGGWRLLGRTEVPLWDLARDEPALLAPGVRVRFTDASAAGS